MRERKLQKLNFRPVLPWKLFFSSLVVRVKTEMIDSSCKSHITGSKGLLSRNVPNHTERSWHPQVHQPLNPSLNYAYEMTDFPGNFSKHPTVVTVICHVPNELALCVHNSVCICAHGVQCVAECLSYTHVRSCCKCIRGMVNTSLPFTHVAHANTQWVQSQHLSQQHMKSP